MSKIICTRYNSTSFLLSLKYDKNLYLNIVKQSGGRWSSKNGWVVPYSNEVMFRRMFELVFQHDILEIEPLNVVVIEPEKSAEANLVENSAEDVAMDESIIEQYVDSDDDVDITDRNKFRRARSATKDCKKPVDNKGRSTLEYYNSFKKTPKEFADTLYDKTDDFEMLSSEDDSSDASSSSGDFPIRSPKRKQHVSDEAVDKMEIMRRRMLEIDIRNKKEKDARRKNKKNV